MCFHAGLPHILYILLGECVSMLDSHSACVFLCWTPTVPQSLYIRLCVSLLVSHRACISSFVNVCSHAGLNHGFSLLGHVEGREAEGDKRRSGWTMSGKT